MAPEPLLGLGRFVNFLILYTVGRTPWMGNQPVARPLPTHRMTQIQNKRFEPTISAFEWAKTVHALDREATVIGKIFIYYVKSSCSIGSRERNVFAVCWPSLKDFIN
jgi:hypothetical protein